MPTTKLNLPLIDGTNTADVVRDMNALANAVDSKAGVSDGLATLDASGKVPASQLNVSAPPDATTTQKGVVQLSNSTTSTSETLAATPKAVKTVDDKIGTLSGLNTTVKDNLVNAVNELFTDVSNGKTQIATAITDKGVAASGGDTFSQLATKIGQISSEVTGETIVKMQTSVALSKGQRVQYTSAIGAKVANPSTLPGGGSYDVAYSSDGVYMASADLSSPYITVYKRSGDTFTKLDNPDVLPTGQASSVAFSPDAAYLAVTYYNAPYVLIYKRSGDTFTKLPNPTYVPDGGSRSVAFSPDGIYMGVAHSGTDIITMYKRAGDTFTKITFPSIVGTAVGGGTISFSPDGVYFARAHQNGSRIEIYKRSGDTFTKLADPSTLPVGMGNDVSFSPDGVYMAVVHQSSPYLTIYKRSGDTFTKLPNPETLPPNTANSVSFAPYGGLLAVAHANSPYVSVYKRNGDTFTKLANPATLPTSTGNGVAFAPFESHITVGHFNSPYITSYKMTGGLEVNEGGIPADYMLGYTKASASVGQTVDVAILFK